MMWGGCCGGGWWGWLAMIAMSLTWALVFVVFVLLLRYLARRESPVGPQGERPPDDLLKKYSRGEISREELLRSKKAPKG
jgi:uncharacterized membrane protein